jgi:hypothetical protein
MSIAASVADVTALSNRNTNQYLYSSLPSGRIPNSTPDSNTCSLPTMPDNPRQLNASQRKRKYQYAAYPKISTVE